MRKQSSIVLILIGFLFLVGCGGTASTQTTPTHAAGTITEFRLPTTESGLGSGLEGITRGPDGNLLFTEYSGNRIGRITPGGTVTEFALPLADSWLEGITAGPDGNLWFTEHDSNQIGRITPGGEPLLDTERCPVAQIVSSSAWSILGSSATSSQTMT